MTYTVLGRTFATQEAALMSAYLRGSQPGAVYTGTTPVSTPLAPTVGDWLRAHISVESDLKSRVDFDALIGEI